VRTDGDLLLQHYFKEFQERMLRAMDILSRFGGDLPDREGYDQLHQEFDSMVGASRAVNLESMERFNRALASLTRYLRNKLPVPASKVEQTLLHESMALDMQCSGSQQSMLDSVNRVEQIIDALDEVIKQAGNN